MKAPREDILIKIIVALAAFIFGGSAMTLADGSQEDFPAPAEVEVKQELRELRRDVTQIKADVARLLERTGGG